MILSAFSEYNKCAFTIKKPLFHFTNSGFLRNLIQNDFHLQGALVSSVCAFESNPSFDIFTHF